MLFFNFSCQCVFESSCMRARKKKLINRTDNNKVWRKWMDYEKKINKKKIIIKRKARMRREKSTQIMLLFLFCLCRLNENKQTCMQNNLQNTNKTNTIYNCIDTNDVARNYFIRKFSYSAVVFRSIRAALIL